MNLLELDQLLLQAHDANQIEELVRLYTVAANAKEAEGSIDAACFYLTHAFVFALECGHDQCDGLQHRLAQFGREQAR